MERDDMCDFKPGDEVTLSREVAWRSTHTGEAVDGPKFGEVYVVTSVFVACGQAALTLAEFDTPWDGGWRAFRFRKVQSRDISAWLETATDFEEPKVKRKPAKTDA